MIMELPVIDVAGLRQEDLEQRRTVAGAIGRACREAGFFYCLGHGIEQATVTALFDASKRFFSLPDVEKRALARDRVGNNRGYVGIQEERLDLTALPDRKEAFNIGLELAPGDPSADEPFRGSNAWPDLPGWRALMLAYYDSCLKLGVTIHRAFSLDLGLPEDFFDDKLDRPIAILRLLRYPGVGADDKQGEAPGAGDHTDYGNLTILATDGVAGLEVRRRDGTWLDAPAIPGAFICNIGDCLMRWSNDAYISTPHRVRVPLTERYSVAFFLDPNPDAPIAPVALAAGAEAKYVPTTGAAYLRSRLDPTYEHTTKTIPG
jgi:isopenicillin N synthase-like dioxygenase